MSPPAGSRRAAFVDRDGVINELVSDLVSGEPESPLRAADVRLTETAVDGLRLLVDAGFVLAGVSNQPAAAKGTVSVAELYVVHQRVIDLLAIEGVTFAAFELCLHHPDGVVPELTGRCDCRKPAPGMLLAAAGKLGADLSRSWMIGDTDTDIDAGRSAGCRTVLVENPDSAHKRAGAACPDRRAPDLLEAAVAILGPDPVSSNP